MNERQWVLKWVSMGMYLKSWGDDIGPDSAYGDYTHDIADAKMFGSLKDAVTAIVNKTYVAGQNACRFPGDKRSMYNSGLVPVQVGRVCMLQEVE